MAWGWRSAIIAMALLAISAPGCSLFLGDGGGDGDDAGLPSSDATLSALGVSRGQLEPSFDPAVTDYTLDLSLRAAAIELTPTAANPGATIAVDGSTVESGSTTAPRMLPLGDSRVEIVVTPEVGEVRVYAIDVNRGRGILEEAYLKASNIGEDDRFGASVAIDGDTLAVGAPLEDTAAPGIDPPADDDGSNRGAVYVFVRSAGEWQQQAFIKPDVTDNGDNFGREVALDGDTLAVSAPFEDSDAKTVNGIRSNDNALSSGAVYVFARVGETWSQQAYIKGSFSDTNDTFGDSIAVDGDTLAVGTPGDDSDFTGVQPGADNSDAPDSGAVYVFVRAASGIWSQQAHIKALNTGAGDRFGASVAIDGDVIAVGAPGESSDATGIDGDDLNDNASNSGAVYVLRRNMVVWLHDTYIKASNTEANDGFGSSVALDGNTLAVGASDEDGGSSGIGGPDDDVLGDSGAVYVFDNSSGTWLQQEYIKASNSVADLLFGSQVALSGDVLVVATTEESSGATGINGDQTDTSALRAGAAYLFTRIGETWTQQAYIKASFAQAGDRLGTGLDVDDGTIAIGAEREAGADGDPANNGAPGAGAAYLF